MRRRHSARRAVEHSKRLMIGCSSNASFLDLILCFSGEAFQRFAYHFSSYFVHRWSPRSQ